MVGKGRLIGREPELSSLASCLERAAGGQGQVVFLAGEAGIGKTALAVEFLARAEAAGHRTLSGHAYLAEGEAPYAVVVDAVRDGLRKYSRTNRESATATGLTSAAELLLPGADKV